MIRYITDHVERARNALKSGMHNANRFKRLLDAFTGEIQLLENTLLDLFYARTIEGATGPQLDLIGRILDEPRDGLSNTQYRRFLRVKIAVLASGGERWRLVDILKTATGATSVQFTPEYPAAFTVYYTTAVPLSTDVRARIKRLFGDAVGSGIGFEIVEAVDVDYFGFSDDPDAAGFGEGVFSEVI